MSAMRLWSANAAISADTVRETTTLMTWLPLLSTDSVLTTVAGQVGRPVRTTGSALAPAFESGSPTSITEEPARTPLPGRWSEPRYRPIRAWSAVGPWVV